MYYNNNKRENYESKKDSQLDKSPLPPFYVKAASPSPPPSKMDSQLYMYNHMGETGENIETKGRMFARERQI